MFHYLIVLTVDELTEPNEHIKSAIASKYDYMTVQTQLEIKLTVMKCAILMF